MTIRPAKRTDQAYVSHSWACSVLGKPAHWGPSAPEINAQIDACLDDQRTHVLIVCDASATDRIHGWIAYARMPGARVLEAIVVRKERRAQGIEAALLTAAELLGSGPAIVHLFDLHGAVAALVPLATKIEAREFLT